MAHRSWCAEVVGEPSNERLEFLGDAVLGWAVADLAFRAHPELTEGRLTDLRKSVVNANALAEVARSLGLGDHLLLGKGEDAGGGRLKPSILSDAIEAVLGAVYLDGGAEAAFAFVERLLGERIRAEESKTGLADYKTMLQELAARRGLHSPVYSIDEWGPDHSKSFRATVLIGGNARGSGEGRSKKQAEQIAAQAAFDSVTADAAAVG